MKTIKDSRVLRPPTQFFYKRVQALKRPSFPVAVLVNSLPKSGTHLATSLLDAEGSCLNSGYHHDERSIAESRTSELARSLRRGYYATAHLPHDPIIRDRIAELGPRILVVLRDPRDIVLSHVHYVWSNHRHPLHRTYRVRDSPLSCIPLTVEGTDASDNDFVLEPLAERIARFSPWITDHESFILRYEDFVDPTNQRSAQRVVENVFAHFGISLSDTQTILIANRALNPHSMTFRTGTAGSWRLISDSYFRKWIRSADCKRSLAALGYG